MPAGVVHRLEQEGEAQPHQGEQVGRPAHRDRKRQEQEHCARHPQRSPVAQKNAPAARRCLFPPAERGEQIRRFKQRRDDGGESPDGAQRLLPKRLRHSHVLPVLQPPVVGFEEEPERHRPEGRPGEFACPERSRGTRRAAQARLAPQAEDRRVRNQDVRRPGDGCEVGGHRLDPAEEQELGDKKNRQPRVAVERIGRPARPREPVEHEERCRCRRRRHPDRHQGHHRPSPRSGEERVFGVPRLP